MTGPAGTTCQVVPDIPSFSVDDGFRYSVPGGTEIEVGSRVRIRIGGRRRRGFVTHVFDPADVPDRPLVDLEGVVGDVPSFAEADLVWLRWCASYYVAPLSVVLARTVPPNVPRSSSAPLARRSGEASSLESVASGHDPVGVVSERIAGADGSVMVVAPTMAEVAEIAERLRHDHDVVVAHSGLPAKDVTAAWVAAACRRGVVLVGTREVSLWPMPDLGHVVVVEDARRVMRSPSTPTMSVRDVVLRRSRAGGFPVTVVAPVPSLEVIAAGARMVSEPGRAWPLVEVADRNEEPPTSSVLMERSRQAIATAVRTGPVFVLVPRRGYAAAFRCASCGTLRRCSGCGAALTGQDSCARCSTPAGPCTTCDGRTWRALGAGIGVVVDDLRRSVGADVGAPGDGAAVTVGTERDLVGRRGMALAVAVDVDGAAFAPTYRAAEDALRLFVRMARTVERGRGRRALVQTSDPEQELVRTLAHGRAEEFLADESRRRKRAGFPPFGQLVALEVQHDQPEFELPLLSETLAGIATVHGPALAGDRWRWLITGPDLSRAKARLRDVVSGLRSAGARVRLDVDAVDL